MYAICAYIGVVLGVNVGIYGIYMECLGMEKATKYSVARVLGRDMIQPNGLGVLKVKVHPDNVFGPNGF